MIHQKHCALRRMAALFLALALAFGCAGCGGASAATMFLRRTEGTVAVADGEGNDVAPKEDLGLFSGYAVGTKVESFAWIDLDNAKLAKLDENSEAHIVKDGKNLSIDVNAGGLFFNVTEPLAEDETMEIRSSSMMVGIRGTCGWVDVPDAQHMNVYLLEGTVAVAAGDNTATVSAGQMAALAADGAIAVSEFDAAAVPGFVAEELAGDESLNEAVREASGLNIAAYSMASYEELLATLENVVSAELVDFEADGSPELLVVRQDDTMSSHPEVLFTIYRSGPDGLQQLFGGGSMGTSYEYLETCSLAERDGKTYVRCYTEARQDADGQINGIAWIAIYYGSVAERDGAASDWGIVDQFYAEENYDYGTLRAYISRHDEKGFAPFFNEREPEVYENPDSYTVVRELCACSF